MVSRWLKILGGIIMHIKTADKENKIKEWKIVLVNTEELVSNEIELAVGRTQSGIEKRNKTNEIIWLSTN